MAFPSRRGAPKACKGFQKEGPWGGEGGSEWTDGTYTGIKQIVIYSADVIDSIHVQYGLEDGSTVASIWAPDHASIWAPRHGGPGGTRNPTITFQYPNETLTKIEGYYGNFYGMTLIKSLTFHTNLAQYGPHGVEDGIHFSSPTTMGRIVGFYGRCGTFLDAIGVYTLGRNRRKKSWWRIGDV